MHIDKCLTTNCAFPLLPCPACLRLRFFSGFGKAAPWLLTEKKPPALQESVVDDLPENLYVQASSKFRARCCEGVKRLNVAFLSRLSCFSFVHVWRRGRDALRRPLRCRLGPPKSRPSGRRQFVFLSLLTLGSLYFGVVYLFIFYAE